MNKIKIAKKQDIWEALKWTGGNYDEIVDFLHTPEMIHNEDIETGELRIKVFGNYFPLIIGDYLFKTNRNHIGLITQDIIDRQWDIVTDECEHPYAFVQRDGDTEKCTKCGLVLCERVNKLNL